jgi:hypothetical protein
MNNDYNFYSDNSLIDLWNKTSLNDLNRIYIYIELAKRNKIYLLNTNLHNELICTKFKLGCFGQRGMIKDIGNKVHLFLFIFTMIFFLLLKYNFLDKNLFFYTIPLSFLLFFHDLISSNYIILTNKNLYVYKKILFFIPIPIKTFSLNNIILYNNLDAIGYFFFNYLSISCNLIIFINPIKYEQILYFSYYKNIYIFHEWLKILLKNNSTCYLFSENFINNALRLNLINSQIRDYNIYDFYNVIKNLSDSIILNIGKNNIQKLSFFMLYNYLKYKIENIDIKKISIKYKFDFLLKNEYIVFIYKPVFFEGFNKKYLIITNYRVIQSIKIDSFNFTCANYYMLTDKKLSFKIHTHDIDIIYNLNKTYTLYWRQINVPIVDLLKFLNVDI